MELFGVAVNPDDTVRVVSAPVVKETAKFYVIERLEWKLSCAFGFHYSTRYEKDSPRVFTNARDAVTAYLTRRQQDKQNALTSAGQATKQIASANELLMHLPPRESANAADLSPVR